MLDFEKELDKLLACESGSLETDEFGLLADEAKRILAAIDRKQTDASLQIEEIYDIVKESENCRDELRLERARAIQLRSAVVGLADMIDDFLHFAKQSSDAGLENQALMMRKNAGVMLESSALERFGEPGQPLDPNLHSVHSAEASVFPHEHISRVLQSGYRYMGEIIRKASVIVSINEVLQYEQDNRHRPGDFDV